MRPEELLNNPNVDTIVALALAEDLGVPAADLLPGASPGARVLERDVTSASVVPPSARFQGQLAARRRAVVCGLPIAERVWGALSRAAGLADPVRVEPLVADGARVEAGTPVARVTGPALAVLAGERTVLNFLMTLSGIATRAAEFQAAAGPSLKVADTRKTYPGLRDLSKYAVAVGGADNHRQGLFDMVLVKDNHLKHAGGVAAAVAAARARHPGLLVQVEADRVDQAAEAARCGADWVLLDNMGNEMAAQAIAAIRREAGHRCLIEISGGVTLDRLPSLAPLGADRASTSAITLAPPVDFGLDEI